MAQIKAKATKGSNLLDYSPHLSSQDEKKFKMDNREWILEYKLQPQAHYIWSVYKLFQ